MKAQVNVVQVDEKIVTHSSDGWLATAWISSLQRDTFIDGHRWTHGHARTFNQDTRELERATIYRIVP